MLHTSYIEISKSALQNNLNYMRGYIAEMCSGPVPEYSMVLKANAYGHGIEEVLGIAEGAGVSHFSLFSVAEAIRAESVANAGSELMIMGWVDEDYLEWVIEKEISYYVFSIERMLQSLEVARRVGKKARIHIELETGMHRTGFQPDQLGQIVQILGDNPGQFDVVGMCTHYAGAESLVNYDRVAGQIQTFNRLSSVLRNKGVQVDYRHTACSAAVFNFPESIMELVRVGIANYGYWPSPETRIRHLAGDDVVDEVQDDPLQRVLSWKSVILSINHVDEGEYISYGQSYLTNRKSRIATVPVGYGYGYNRTLSNNGHVLVNGYRVPVIGTVNMNMLVIDVTDADGVEVGDQVVLIGRQGDLTISVSSFVEMNNSMNYEMLTRLPDHIPRVIVP